MKVTAEMEINDVLALDEAKISKTLAWLAPDLGRLQYPSPTRATIGTVTIRQAARIAQMPLTEMLFVLNLAVGESTDILSAELRSKESADH
jgi:hypothetical protein